MTPDVELTRILRDVAGGRREEADRLLEAVYADLRRLAARHMRAERPDHTLQATALVHEAWMRLIDQRSVEWRDRAHFLAMASNIIRRILVDHARRRRTDKRGGDRQRVAGPEPIADLAATDVDLVGLDDALRDLAELSPQQAMRFFGGLTIPEIAEVLELGRRTVDREWSCARAWLFEALQPGDGDGSRAG
jgi:RNA polymerase sigma factor (TIGR02999 family)